MNEERKPWAEAGLSIEERAKRALDAAFEDGLLGCSPEAVTPIAEALRAARADALDEAAKAICSGCADGLPVSWYGRKRHVMKGGADTFPCHAAAIRALKDRP